MSPESEPRSAGAALRWLTRAARLALLLVALVILLAALSLLLLERSGRLKNQVRAALAERLGEPLSIRSASLSWTDAAIEIEGLSLGLADRAAELERVRVVFREGRGGLPRVAQIEVDGGRILLCEELQDDLAQRLAALGGADERADQRLPSIVVRDLQVDLRHPAWGEIPIGTVRGAWTADESGRPRIEGRLAPSLVDQALVARSTEPVELYLSGREDRPGEIDLAVSSDRLPFSLEVLGAGTVLEPLRAIAPRGRLTLDAHVRVRLDALLSANGEVRARLEDGSLLAPTADAPIEGVTLDLAAVCAPGSGQDVASRAAWRAVAKASANWSGARLEAGATTEGGALDARTARAWLSARNLPLQRETLAALGLDEVLDDSWKALEPAGSCSVYVAAELPEDERARLLIEVDAEGAASVAYHGWLSKRDQLRHGFPMRTHDVEGRLLIAHDPARLPETHLAIVGVRGVVDREAPAERWAWIDGQVHSSTPESPTGEWAIRYGGRGIAIDGEGIPRGLRGLPGTDWIWPAFLPTGGRASFQARMQRTRADKGMVSSFDIEMRDSGFTWDQLPIPLSQVDGRVSLLFAPEHSWAVAFEATGKTLTSERARVRGRLQRAPDSLGGALQDEIAVEVENVALRGIDRERLEARFPEVGRVLEELAPAGKVDASYLAATPGGADDGRFWLEITPREVQLSPRAFRVQTSKVRGRVLIGGRRVPASGSQERSLDQVRTRVMPLVGSWAGEALVAATADVPAVGQRRLRLHAAGVDPLNRGLVGALREALVGTASGYAGLDLSALSVGGRVDVVGDMVLDPERGAEAGGSSRVFLRDNDFKINPPSGSGEASSFGLDGLNGVLEQSEGRLAGENIRARLGVTPVRLREASFVLRDGGYVLDARPEATGVPLDAEHLRFFLDPKTVEALVEDLGFRGSIDLEDARLELAGSKRTGGRVQFSGRVRPRNARVAFGLPLEIDSASVEIQNLVFENGRVRAWAGVRELDGRLAGRRLRGARMQLTYVEPHLSILDLDGELEGGRLTDLGAEREQAGPAFSIDLFSPFPFELGLNLDSVEVEGLLRGLFQSEFASRGVLSGELRLTGSLEEVRGIRGDGSLSLRDSTLWSIPVMRALFSQLGFDDTAVFESMRSRFSVREGVVDMSAVQVYSPLLQLVGAGRLDFEGRLHHDLEVRYGLVDQLGPLNRLVYWIQNNLLRIAIRGDMSRPRIELEGFFSVFQREAESGRDLPLPPLSPLPERF